MPPIWRATCGSRSGPRIRIATTAMIKSFPGSRLSTGLGRKSDSARLDSGFHSSYSDWVIVRMCEPSDHDAIGREGLEVVQDGPLRRDIAVLARTRTALSFLAVDLQSEHPTSA